MRLRPLCATCGSEGHPLTVGRLRWTFFAWACPLGHGNVTRIVHDDTLRVDTVPA